MVCCSSAYDGRFCSDLRSGVGSPLYRAKWDSDGYIRITTNYNPAGFDKIVLVTKRPYYSCEDVLGSCLCYSGDCDRIGVDIDPCYMSNIYHLWNIPIVRYYTYYGDYCAYWIRGGALKYDEKNSKVHIPKETVDTLPFKIMYIDGSFWFVTDFYVCGYYPYGRDEDERAVVYEKVGNRWVVRASNYWLTYHFKPGREYGLGTYYGDRYHGPYYKIKSKEPPYEELKKLGGVYTVIPVLAYGEKKIFDIPEFKNYYQYEKHIIDYKSNNKYISAYYWPKGQTVELLKKYFGIYFRGYILWNGWCGDKDPMFMASVAVTKPNYTKLISSKLAPCERKESGYTIETEDPNSKIVKKITANIQDVS